MMPATWPSSTTGRCRNPPWIMREAAWSVVSVASIVSGWRVIHSETRPLRVPAGDGAHQVALREDALEPFPLEHEDRSDPARDHALRRLAEPVARRDGEEIPGHVVGDD